MKSNAHDLIYDLQMLERTKGQIYTELAKRLGVSNKDAHIGNMTSVDKVSNAIFQLELMVSYYESKWNKKKQLQSKVIKPKQLLPQAEMGMSLRALKIQKEHPLLYKHFPRIFYFIYGGEIVG